MYIRSTQVPLATWTLGTTILLLRQRPTRKLCAVQGSILCSGWMDWYARRHPVVGLMRIHVIGKPKIFGGFLSGVPAGSRGVNEGSLGRYGNPQIRDIQDSPGITCLSQQGTSCSAHQDHQPVGRRKTRAMIGKAQRNCRVSGLDHRLSPSSHVAPHAVVWQHHIPWCPNNT